MSASARATSSSIVLVLLLAASQINCGGDDERSLPGPGSGLVDTSLDDDVDVEDESGEGGQAGGADPVGEEPDDVPSGEGIEEGACDEEGRRQTCVLYNAYGCLQGNQACVDGEWTDCSFSQDA